MRTASMFAPTFRTLDLVGGERAAHVNALAGEIDVTNLERSHLPLSKPAQCRQRNSGP
jgi:hypothetical protein